MGKKSHLDRLLRSDRQTLNTPKQGAQNLGTTVESKHSDTIHHRCSPWTRYFISDAPEAEEHQNSFTDDDGEKTLHFSFFERFKRQGHTDCRACTSRKSQIQNADITLFSRENIGNNATHICTQSAVSNVFPTSPHVYGGDRTGDGWMDVPNIPQAQLQYIALLCWRICAETRITFISYIFCNPPIYKEAWQSMGVK